MSVSSLLAPLLAAVGLLAVAVVFTINVKSFHDEVVAWAERDLAARTERAAEALAEPLETQDLRRIRAYADACLAEETRLTVLTGGGGLFFSNAIPGESLVAERPCGEYRIRLLLPAARVNRPFVRAISGFVLAFVVGLAGMFFVFLTLYRQRVRIRELARLEKFRREFIADVSHEIKTPLTGILGASDLLGESLGDGDDRPRKQLVGLIAKEAARLNGLVQSILDLARIEREDRPIERVPTDLSSLVVETVARFQPKAEAANVRLSAENVADGVWGDCDAALVSQALSNLIENALRHAHSPDVAVGLSVAGDRVVLTVTDHGIGLPPEARARIFERFYRVDPARAAETGGAGLGLAIVRRIARLHGGDAQVEPVVPTGCRFSISIQSKRST